MRYCVNEIPTQCVPYNKYFHFLAASSPPPQSSTVNITTPDSSLIICWTPPSNTSNVGGYMFTVTGEDCGDCVNITVNADTTNTSCSDYIVNGQTCYFKVSTVSEDCGFISESVTKSVLLMGKH